MIAKMKKLRLITVTPQREELLRELMLLGCVHISEPPAGETERLPGFVRGAGEDAARLRADRAAMLNGIRLLDDYAPARSRFLSPLPDVPVRTLLDEGTLAEDLALARRIAGLDGRIRQLTAEESSLRAEIESLRPWRELDMPLDWTGTATTSAAAVSFPASADLGAAETALRGATEAAELFRVSADKSLHYAVLVCFRADLDAAVTALRPFGYAVMSPGGRKGTARENIARLEARLGELAADKTACAAEIADGARRRDGLKLRADTLATKVDRAEAEEKLLSRGGVSCLEGWIPAESEAALTALLDRYDCAWETVDPRPEEYPEVPVTLKNNGFSRPLNVVTEMYSLPAYDGVDPNPLMAPFFILFFGIMFCDMAYGLLMMIGSAVVRKKKRPKGSMRTFMDLLFDCGVAAFIMGALTGSFFGNAVPAFLKMLNPASTFDFPSLFNPLEDTVYVLVGGMILGAIQIITGMAISFVMQTKEGRLRDALMDIGSWWLLFIGIGVGAFAGFWWVAAAGALSLVLTQGRDRRGIAAKLGGGIASLYNITGYFGDVLSYSRLMALMLAGSVIAQVFNTLAALPGNIFVFFIIFAAGHAINFGLNLLGCFVHDMRLQCLEFFGKFYKDGGKPFKPLRIDAKYVNYVN